MGRYVFSGYFGHDGSMAIVGEGRIAHFEVERFTRRKHDSITHEHTGQFLEIALGRLGIGMDEIVGIAGIGCAADFGGRGGRLWWDTELAITDKCASAYLQNTVREACYVPHHMAHAAYAFYTSPFEEASVIAIDGGGDAWRDPRDSQLHVIDTAAGTLKQAFGETGLVATLPRIPNTGVGGTWDGWSRKLCNDDNYAAGTVMAMIGIPPERWEAETGLSLSERDEIIKLQDWTTETFRKLVLELPSRNLALAGGVALNGIAVYAMLKEGLVDRVHVPPAVHDGGLPVGAALHMLHNVLGEPRVPYSVETVGFPGYSDAELDREPPIDQIVDALVAGKTVALCHGQAESGPRALGHRSILADPRKIEMRDKINRIKGRQVYRPVAPVVMKDRLTDYFDAIDGDAYSYMTCICQANDKAREATPAALHYDGSARVQTVTDDSTLGAIVKQFGERTGVPVMLNTSFNLGGEAMVNDGGQARDTFSRSEIDVLVVGDTVTHR